MKRAIPRVWHIYIIECCTPHHIYVGITRGSAMRRWLQHAAGLGARFTRAHGVHRATICYSTYSMRDAEWIEHFQVKELRRLNPWACVRGAHHVARCSHLPSRLKPPWFDTPALLSLLEGLRLGSIQLGDEVPYWPHRT